MCLIFLLPFLLCVSRERPRNLAYFMDFIARSGLLILSVLALFALFEVRYDTLRRRDDDAVSVASNPQHLFWSDAF